MPATNHFIFIGAPEVSHLRNLVRLNLNLLDLHPSLVTTLIISDSTVSKYEKEYNLQPSDLMQRIKSRFKLRIVETGISTDAELGEAMPSYASNLPAVLQDVIEEARQTEGRWKLPCGIMADVSGLIIFP